MPFLSYWLGYAVAMSSHGLFLGVCGLGLGTGLRSTGPGLAKILGPDLQHILRQSYDYLTIMPNLRSTYDRRLIFKTS